VRRKHLRTLEEVFRRPTASGIKRDDIISLLEACGAYLSERKGSRIAVKSRSRKAIFHRPHPRRTIDKGMVEGIRKFLEEVGVKPS